MNTPICDFVRRYAEKQGLRLHMPGHKGVGFLGVEHLDITEIIGADSLYEARGIIRQSEENAGDIFGACTYYSTEGSTLAIRAMLYLAMLYAAEKGESPLIFAGRNAHKSFINTAAMLDFSIRWLCGEGEESCLSCRVTPEYLEGMLKNAHVKPTAVYITSPDYLGNIADIKGLAEVCHRYSVLLLVDNAHGSYLRFLPESRHPIDLGADACCDSAHKTLPVLTGGAYLHISVKSPDTFKKNAKNAMSLFGSTSPSYLILQSLDAANKYLYEGFREELVEFISLASKSRSRLLKGGFFLKGNEPLKFTVDAALYGYSGKELAWLLREENIECEFADCNFLVLMLTPQIGCEGLDRLCDVLLNIPRKKPLQSKSPQFRLPEKILSPRQAALSPCETLAVEDCVGKICAVATVGCPPAVPIVCSGERIDEFTLELFKYYGIENCCVIKE